MFPKKKSEKMKGGVVDSVAYSNGKGGHIPYAAPKVGRNPRSVAAGKMKKGGY